MKYIKKFENFDNNSNSTKVNEEFVGLGVLALGWNFDHGPSWVE
jgi:hypothetical protein